MDGDPSGNALTKSQKVVGEDGGSKKNSQSYGDDDAEESEDERPHGRALFNGEGMTDGCECRLSDIIFQGGKPFFRMSLLFG